MPKRNIAIFVVIIIIIVGAVYGLRRVKEENISSDLFPEEKNINPHFIETINYIVENITDLSPEKAILGGSWQVLRFEFVDANHLYVEYEDGHILRRILIEQLDNTWKILAYFKQGKDMWELISGKDIYFGAALIIYNKNDKGQWLPAY
ncbi:hypothetical protein D4R86_03620 [bacterium]|nr:MAG: hypothetical protein D4R86_03620 [bacterium]